MKSSQLQFEDLVLSAGDDALRVGAPVDGEDFGAVAGQVQVQFLRSHTPHCEWRARWVSLTEFCFLRVVVRLTELCSSFILPSFLSNYVVFVLVLPSLTGLYRFCLGFYTSIWFWVCFIKFYDIPLSFYGSTELLLGFT